MGQVDDGLLTLAEAFRLAEATEESAITPPLLLCQDELRRMQAGTPFGHVSGRGVLAPQILDVVRDHQTKSWELGAALQPSAGLWQRQGKRPEARALLAGTYDWFTEAFDTTDLQEAKALVDALA